MAKIRIYFAELQNRQVPPLCIGCGRPMHCYVNMKYNVTQHTRGWNSRTWHTKSITLPVPLCRRHDRSEEGIGTAVALGEHSIVLSDISRRFCEELDDLRDENAELHDRLRHLDDDLDDDRDAPRRRRRRSRDDDDEEMFEARQQRSVGGQLRLGMAILGGIVLMGFLCIGASGLLGRAMLGPRPGNPGNRPVFVPPQRPGFPNK